MKRNAMVSVYPDDCECSARDRCICTQACKPTRHKIRCAVVTGKGKCSCGASSEKPARRTKYPLGKPLVVAMTEGRIAANAKAAAERAFAEKWHAISGFIYIHPCDFTIGKDVHWHRRGGVLHGTVVKVNDDMLKPAKVLRKGPVRYHYTPSVYDFCDAEGRKPCVCDLPIGQRTECQHKPHCPVPGIDAKLRGSKSITALKYDGPPGVKLMQGHSPAALACVAQERNRQLEVYRHGAFHSSDPVPDMVIAGSMMGPGEYAKTLTIDPLLGDYCVRPCKDGHGIYLRSYNVRLATFAPNSAALRERLTKLFDDAKAKDKSDDEIARGLVKWGKMSIPQRIKVRQKRERETHKGWYTCQCGQWVNDKECPCSVCVKPKRKPRKKK